MPITPKSPRSRSSSAGKKQAKSLTASAGTTAGARGESLPPTAKAEGSGPKPPALKKRRSVTLCATKPEIRSFTVTADTHPKGREPSFRRYKYASEKQSSGFEGASSGIPFTARFIGWQNQVFAWATAAYMQDEVDQTLRISP